MLRDEVAWIPLTRGWVTVVDKVDADLGTRRWSSDGATVKRAYAVRRGKRWSSAIFLHRVIAERMGLDIADKDVDHIDGNRLNNRRSNLRAATRSENARNSGARRNSKSGIKGVHLRDGRWIAQIGMSGRRVYLGSFATIEAAAAAYAEAAKKYHGEFARTE